MLSGLRIVSREKATSSKERSPKRSREEGRKSSKEHGKRREKIKSKRRKKKTSSSSESSDDDAKRNGDKKRAIEARKSMGLEWMVEAPQVVEIEKGPVAFEAEVEEKFQVNPKELNPYMKDGGDGHPPENVETLNFPQSSHAVVGDGGLSWRLKALKRAKEQAEREGRTLHKVVEERWGSIAEMTANIAGKKVAHSHAHLHAIRDRKHSTGDMKSEERIKEHDKDIERSSNRDYLKDVRTQDMRMRVPREPESLSWKKKKTNSMLVENTEIFQEAAASMNEFKNDGSFLQSFQASETKTHAETMCNPDSQIADVQSEVRSSNVGSISTVGMTANQLAAKALQLRLSGKIKEAEQIQKQLEIMKKEVQITELGNNVTNSGMQDHMNPPKYNQSLKSIIGDYQHRSNKNKSGDDGLMESIVQNKKYSSLTCVDDEYEFGSGHFEDSKLKKSKKKGSKDPRDIEAKRAIQSHKRIITQEERCQFCFNNPSRSTHLTISIGNYCYLMLTPWEPLVEGHCLIVPMQHETSSRNVDDSIWEELRNFKKCLLQMFASRNEDVLFMETAMHLARQRRHCLIECIPVPPDVAKQAPLYFKKAIDEAEDEWSQHNAKKLIDTSGRGLRACIPKNFPYFNIEFGLHSGYVHVIDNENDFKSDFGRNVIIGMLKLPEEEMYRRRKQYSHEHQKKAAAEFRGAWDPFDWTKMLD